MDTTEQVKDKIRRLKDFLVRCKEVEDKSFVATKELSTLYQKLTDVLTLERNTNYRFGGNNNNCNTMSISNELSLSSTKVNIEIALAYYRQQLSDLEGF